MKFGGFSLSRLARTLLIPLHHNRRPVRVAHVLLLLLSFVASNITGLTPTQILQAQATVLPPIFGNASDVDGGVVKVEFLADGGLIAGCEDNTAAYQCTWSGATIGSHTLLARATDNFSATATSTPVTVTIENRAPVV